MAYNKKKTWRATANIEIDARTGNTSWKRVATASCYTVRMATKSLKTKEANLEAVSTAETPLILTLLPKIFFLNPKIQCGMTKLLYCRTDEKFIDPLFSSSQKPEVNICCSVNIVNTFWLLIFLQYTKRYGIYTTSIQREGRFRWLWDLLLIISQTRVCH